MTVAARSSKASVSNEDADHGFAFQERILVSPSTSRNSVDVRLESAMTLTSSPRQHQQQRLLVHPFPLDALALLERHRMTRLLVQMGTTASTRYSSSSKDGPLLGAVPPLHTGVWSRPDLGPSGILVRAQFLVEMDINNSNSNNGKYHGLEQAGKEQFLAILRDLTGQRVLLAPFFSITNRRLHRHVLRLQGDKSHRVPLPTPVWVEESISSSTNRTLVAMEYETVFPMEGAPLAAEGMRVLQQLWAPCHNDSGIFAWNNPHNMSSLFVERASSKRHSFWIQLEQQTALRQLSEEQGTDDSATTTTTTTLVKGMQYNTVLQPPQGPTQANLNTTPASNETTTTNRTISLSDVFPLSKRHRMCPFVDQATLETMLPAPMSLPSSPVVIWHMQPLASSSNSSRDDSNTSAMVHMVHALDPKPQNWKEPWMTIVDSNAAGRETSSRSTENVDNKVDKDDWLVEVQQTLQRPRGVSYKGTLLVQLDLSRRQGSNAAATEQCPLTVDWQWFLPPIVQPTWQSFRAVLEDVNQQVEQVLSWRTDLQGSIQSNNDDGTLVFRIPDLEVDRFFLNDDSSSSTTHHHRRILVSLDYQPAFLSFEHFPGDANRGIEIPPAVATLSRRCPITREAGTTNVRLYSHSLLLLPPTPDMSMPFNVISMTCSLYAFSIGSILNLLIRRSSERIKRTLDPSSVPETKLQKLKAKLKTKLLSLKSKLRRRRGHDGEKVRDEKEAPSVEDDSNKDGEKSKQE